ncbi:MAG TPA: glycosyltransferase [Gaiellaceae bacterium]|nr:glycosyltransferase [Gaiellaceae bacterium]
MTAVAAGKALARAAAALRTAPWPDHSRLFAVGDRGGWSVDEDAEHLAAAARRLGYRVGPPRWARFAARQAVFVTSHFDALGARWLATSHRLATAYLHGRPGTPGIPEFDECFATLRRHRDRFWRVQVTHAEMHELVLAAGVSEERVFRIPLGIDLERFPLADEAHRTAARAALGLPATAFVAGSFQKDGVGWGEGLQPKLVKGPDVLVAALERLRADVPELHVLLTGPARGYVKQGLERLGIPYRHVLARSREELARAYHALDVYLVPSRQEGGPKAVLEALATGIPLVSTKVGQAQELVEHGVSGWLVEVEDAEGLAGWAARARDGVDPAVRAAGRALAEAHAYERLDPLWAELLEGFVVRAD